MEVLEKNHSWKEPDFDTVLQYLRTVLLRRTSLIQVYYMQSALTFRQMAPLSYTPPRTQSPSSRLSSTPLWESRPSSNANRSNTTS